MKRINKIVMLNLSDKRLCPQPSAGLLACFKRPQSAQETARTIESIRLSRRCKTSAAQSARRAQSRMFLTA
jgi:hypothetical protein